MGDNPKNRDETEGSGHSGVEWFPAIFIGVVALISYYLTSAPTVTWIHDSQDSGELAAAAACFGIPHPTGYPLYMLLGGILIRLFGWVDPGRVMVLISVVSGAVAICVMARVGGLASRWAWGSERLTAWQAGWVGALGSGFILVNPIFWGQSVVCEVYAFAMLLQALMWLALVKYLQSVEAKDEKGSQRRFILIGFTVGLIAAHHLVGLAILIAVLITVIFKPPSKVLEYIPLFLIAMLPGLLLYLYLPVASSMNPEVDWGNPETIGNFVDHVTGSQYSGRISGGGVSTQESHEARRFQHQVIKLTTRLAAAGIFLLVAAFIRLVGIRGGSAGKVLLIGIIPFAIVIVFHSAMYEVSDNYIFLYPLVVAVPLFLSVGISQIALLLGKIHKSLFWVVFIFLIWMVASSFEEDRTRFNVSEPLTNSSATFSVREIANFPQDAVVIVSSDGHYGSLIYTSVCGLNSPGTGERIRPRPDLLILPLFRIHSKWFHENLTDRGIVTDSEALESLSGMGYYDSLVGFIELMTPERRVFVDSAHDRARLMDYGFDVETIPRSVFFEVKKADDMLQSPRIID